MDADELRLLRLAVARGRCGSLGGGILVRGRLDLMGELLDHEVGAAQDPLLQARDLLLDGGLVLRQVAGEIRDLRPQDGADPEDQGQREEDREDHGRHPASRRRCRKLVTGARTKLSRTASTSGMNTSRPK